MKGEIFMDANRMKRELGGGAVFPIGAENTAYAQYITGECYLNMLTTSGVGIGVVTFAPGTINAWHIHHKGGQILLVTGGRGWYQEDGKPARALAAGDVVNIPPEVKHWHGAAVDCWFQHLAVEVPAEGASNEWRNSCLQKIMPHYNAFFMERSGSYMAKARVYFTREITPQAMDRLYDALGIRLSGKTAVKISTGEPGGHNFLQPALIGPLTERLHGTIVECNTAYEGRRNTTQEHWKAIQEHGFLDIAPCDIMDETGELALPVTNGMHLQENFVGAHLRNYDSMLVLSHFKGHMMGGFGGALKNISIGIASAHGKAHIHGVGVPEELWTADHNSFLECMADAAKSVVEYLGRRNMAFINVANRLSVDCDCDAHPHEPEMADIGVFASLDPVALDQACVDAVYASPDPGKAALIERMESRNGIHTVETACALGIGVREYELIYLD